MNKYADLRSMKRLTLSGSIFIVLYDTGETKVSDLAHQTLINQDIGSPQVSVNVVPSFDVGHAFCCLRRQRQLESQIQS